MSASGRRLTLGLLTFIYAFGFIDRIVIALVAQGMKAELRISDLQIGLLGGSAFAAVNVFAALPVARISERLRRTWVVAACLGLASAFACLSGFAASYLQLLLLRMGMAVGSAGTEAPAHSAISDMYPPHKRASALAIFSLGVPVAAVAGSFLGGALGQSYGWRSTFLVFGGLGLLLACVGFLLMCEPERGTAGASAEPNSVLLVAHRLWRHRHFRHLLAAACICSMASFGVNTFLPALLMRGHGLGGAKAGLLFGLISGVASAVGALGGGVAAERLARRNPAWLLGAPGVGLLIGAPLLLFGALQSHLIVAVAALFAGSCFFYTWLAPAIATTHELLDSRSRATGSALFLMAMHLVGQGLGPPLMGFASDRIAAWRFGAANYALCAGEHNAGLDMRCATASADGLRYATAAFSVIFLWAALHFILGARARRPS
jgi:predicted MFS family arabinose efflux permease